ncbi:MAG: hypothetical protein WKG07_38825 [Hymenobacter sp.]
MDKLKIIGLEEHVALQPLLDAWANVPGIPQVAELGYGDEPLAQRLRDVGPQRLADMDDLGVDVQVLSLSTPGVQVLRPGRGGGRCPRLERRAGRNRPRQPDPLSGAGRRAHPAARCRR